MGTIIVNTNVSLDGVSEDPTGEEGFAAGGWFAMSDGDRELWAKREFEEAMRTSALLLGRRTDVWFGTRWNDREGAWAERLRELPKYVVSSTTAETVWANGTVITGDVVEQVTRIKETVDGEIVVFGSRQLVQALLAHDLIDEFRIFVFGSVLGAGDRLFGELAGPARLRLTAAERIGDQLLYVGYDVVRD